MKWTVSVIVGAVIVLGLIIAFSSKSSNGTTTTTGPVGSYKLSSEKMDLGEMAVNDEKSADFTFRNTSKTKMSLGSFETSCNCTMASVKIGSTTSPMFNMKAHMSVSEANWSGELDPGETATINLMYKPALMPVYGPVERYATFKINNSKEIRLTVSATVK